MDYNGLETTLHQRLEEAVTMTYNVLLDENGDFLTDEEGAYILQSPLDPIPLINYPNIIYDESQETTEWIRPSVLFGSATSSTLGRDGINFVNGIYQVSIFTALNTGTFISNKITQRVLKAFPKGERLSFGNNVIMVNVGYQSTGLYEDEWLHTPLTIPFTAHMEV